MTSDRPAARRRPHTMREEKIYWPQPVLDHVITVALYQADPGALSFAARHLRHVSPCGIRHFRAVRRAVPLQQAQEAASQIRRSEHEERMIFESIAR